MPQASSGSATPRAKGARRRWPRILMWSVVGLLVLGVALIALAYVLIDIPEPNDRAVSQASVIYYSDGETEMDRIATVNREAVDIDKVPTEVRHAFVAAEDRSFYENRGISPKGILRAVSAAVSGGQQQGGSTITQQYVKNYFLTQDQTLTRKAKEVLISVKIDGELSKKEILANYLNTIYFGRGADGIQTASQAYFRKDVEELTVSEGAFLASVVNGPSLYDPALGDEQRERAEDRWAYVLDGMVEKGWLTASERDRMEFPKVRSPQRQSSPDDIGFITEEVRDELRTKVGLSEADIARGGYKIVTTIDKDAQEAAAEAVADARPTEKGSSDVHIGLAAVKPGDGAIRAMYGGPTFGEGRYGYFNAAVDGKMQAGSTMKPFTMIAALREGMPLSTTFSGNSPYYDEAFVYDQPGATAIQRRGGIVNFSGADYGPVTMREATKKSINTYYAQLNLAAGPKETAEAATQAGVRSWNGNRRIPFSKGPTNVFGTDAVRVIDMAGAYATIAAQGRYAEPYYITSVTGTGDRDYEYEVEKNVERVYPKDVARDAIQAMSQVASPGGTGYPTVAELNRPVGGKTGTTSGNYAAWFDGFTPGQLATAVGMYRGDGRLVEENQLMNLGGYAEVTGGTIPAEIWTDFMIGALDGEPVKELPPAGNVEAKQRSSTPTDVPTPLPTTTEAPEPDPTSTSSTSSSTTSSSSSSRSSSSSSSSSTSSTSTSSSSSSSSSTSSTSSTTTKEPTSSTSTRPSESPTSTRPSPTSSTPSEPRPTRTSSTAPPTTPNTPPSRDTPSEDR